jgi:hypothetical protein
MTMTRLARLGVVACGLVLAILAVVGCGTGSKSEGRAPVVGQIPTTPASESSAPGKKLFANWPKPAGAILISGEQLGFLEPCGCTKGQRGGLARRMDLIEKLRAQGWPLALIDLGSLINDPNDTVWGGPEETRIRYGIALKALETLGYDALALSAPDLKLGVADVLIRYVNHQGEKLKIVAANATPEPSLGLAERVVPAVRTKAGPINVGITAVIDPESFAKLHDPDKETMLAFRQPESVLPDVLAELERDTHIQVLMVQGSPEAARRLALAHKGFEVVVATSPYVDPPDDAEMLNDGKTQLISVGRKGQYVGVLGLFQDAKQKFRYQRVPLGSTYNDKTEAMRKLLDEDFQAELRDADVLGTFLKRAYVFGDGPTGATYVGADTCKTCHPNTYAKWANTGHFRAYEALTKAVRNRVYDAQCISCHTTGFPYNGGFVSADRTPDLKGNQCENCHGPGSKHAAQPTDPAILATVRRSAADFQKNHRCIECHSEDDSPDFNFEVYWPKIVHKGLDTYDDPKVRQGIEPKELARSAAEAGR